MALLDELKPGIQVRGLLPGKLVTLVEVKTYGTTVAEVIYKDAGGQLSSVLLYPDDLARLEIVQQALSWRFEADGSLFRLISEAYRISLAYLFDPLLAVHTSLIEPLPHQITAVYETMLTKQPLRYLLADDPGAGKTIMTGLLLKELLIRGDAHRCLIVAPGNLVEQWQDELSRKFHLSFEILTNDRLEASVTGNAFEEMPLCIGRLDKLSRDERVQERLKQTTWDIVVVDEAHKMSASFFSGEAHYTRRYHLGELLGNITRHLLLLTATPHNGKEEDFQLFLRLLDVDRFENSFRAGVQPVDVSDVMRHLVKEQLYTFEGTPLFPERLAYTLNYQLSGLEARLYREVTDYVREEFNRADALESGRKGTVGFALTTLQRRLASSPEAIYQSLRRRRERLERRVQEARQQQAMQDASGQGDINQGDREGRPYENSDGRGDPRGRPGSPPARGANDGRPGSPPARGANDGRPGFVPDLPTLTEDDLEDLEDAPGAELEELEEQVVDRATAARTVAELEAELLILSQLEERAREVRRSGTDRKWEELASLLQGNEAMFDAGGKRLKLVIFTEHRDTLNYLSERIRTMLGRDEAVVTIHGGLNREERFRAQEAFTQDPEVQILVATDAAGEGINLQRAHLMVNYDLPWNPNRLEQRFGRIHRIGQTEVCHLWNLVAAETREGEVFSTLLRKLEEERDALGGKVFDVLGKVQFESRPLRELIVEAIRYGDRPEVRARLSRVVDEALDRDHLEALLEERALVSEVMDVVRVRKIREEMERAEARRLQPHFIAAFFLEALKYLGGSYHQREPGRYEITFVPAELRHRLPRANARTAILRRYERVVFEKALVTVPGKPQAALLAPGHPLLDATIALLLERHRDLLAQGSVLIDPTDLGESPRVLFYLEHTIADASHDSTGRQRVVSRQLQFVELDESGTLRPAGYAPFLDYRPPDETERALLAPLRQAAWLQGNLEERAKAYAITELVPRHFAEVKARREAQITKTLAAVNERLTTEIMYWDRRAVDLQQQEAQGKINARLNSQQARARAEELHARLERRVRELERERQLSPQPPLVISAVLVVPQGLLTRLGAAQQDGQDGRAARQLHDTARIGRLAMEAVMEAERRQGYQPRDVSADKCGYDIESRIPGEGRLRFLEVKGRVHDAETVTVTKNEILTALNKPDDFFLVVVLIDGDEATPYYIARPFTREPDFGATSVNYALAQLLPKGVIPV